MMDYPNGDSGEGINSFDGPRVAEREAACEVETSAVDPWSAQSPMSLVLDNNRDCR
jgi:hypothetical protein